MRRNKILYKLSVVLFLGAVMLGCQTHDLAVYQLSSQVPTVGPAHAIGSYSLGCLEGAQSMDSEGRGFVTMRTSRGRFWGHPELLELIQKVASQFHKRHKRKLLIGDLSHARGGPNLTGHSSHQTGLDVDIWLHSLSQWETLSLGSRETKVAPLFLPQRMGQKTNRMIRLLKDFSREKKVQRIFVNSKIKKFLCQHQKVYNLTDKDLAKIRPWWGHDRHFHVRMRCPHTSPHCEGQKEHKTPSCDETLEWWFSEEAKLVDVEVDYLKRFDQKMSQLPKECSFLKK